MERFCDSLCCYARRKSCQVRVGEVLLGGDNPLRVQSMTNTDTGDTQASVAQIKRIAEAGGEIVRLTAQGQREAANLANIKRELLAGGCTVPLVADIHFVPAAALTAAENVDKVRINPGNFNDKGGQFHELVEICKRRGVALRIGVNHGSLAPSIVQEYGDTPAGMVASAMEFLGKCAAENFDQVVVSLKSSNVRVMVQAYRMLVAKMRSEGMNYPLHLGVTEAGDGEDGRVKSAVGIGALLLDGIGDTIRVSLTEAPEREIPVARALVSYFEGRSGCCAVSLSEQAEAIYSPYEYKKRISRQVVFDEVLIYSDNKQVTDADERSSDCLSEHAGANRIGGGNKPVLWSELSDGLRSMCRQRSPEDIDLIAEDEVVVMTASDLNGTTQQRAFFLEMISRGMSNPVIIKQTYNEHSLEQLQIKAAADLGVLFLDGFGDGLWIENLNAAITQQQIESLSLGILQAARVRISKAEYIACPSCGRTLYDIESVLAQIKARTSHLIGIKIGVMGCIVNGPGEMADADYGYVGSGAGRVTLYKGQSVVKRDVKSHDAIDELVELIKRNGDWYEPAR